MKTTASRRVHRLGLSLRRAAAGAAVAAVALVAATEVLAQEPAECLSLDPSKWPAPSKPYFMVAFDTSGSMTEIVNAVNTCGYPNNRLGHGRCALQNTILAYAGQANFGLASYARVMTGCNGANGACFTGCTYQNLPNNVAGTQCSTGCGPEPSENALSTTRAGANILVPLLQDNYFAPPPKPTNVPELLDWVDNDCTGSKELFADGCTPLNGILRDMYRYLSDKWVHPAGAPTYVSPLESLANGERPCRSVNVILVTDGDETCDTDAAANDAAANLYAGFTKGGITWKVKTFVINFAGGSKSKTDAIAAAGGTGSSYFANNEAELSTALANIIAGSVQPEVCDNTDNNCNGCTDEGFKHYCNVGQTCCSWGNASQRNACLASYKATITPQNPSGDVTKLPCTTMQQKDAPSTWLCFDPKETCDDADNNCDGNIDENVLKCGDPAHCPAPETCNGLDDDCDGQIDDPGSQVCGNECVPSQEICDGCDNDCDGIADNGIAPIPCGLEVPANCKGNLACKAPKPVPQPGDCVAGGGFGQCSFSPQAETCDGLDNDCDGQVDDNIPPTECVPAGTPGNLVYGGTSQCKKGSQSCGGACIGFVGPSVEICDGIDNDCDGQVDDSPAGVGKTCGVNQPPCKPGVTACVNGALVCQGGVGGQPETCDGVDNDCDGQVDEAPLADGPAPGQNGCWNEPGNCCTFANLTWCPPPGGTCNDVGSLAPPCNKGTLSCSGKDGWVCKGPKGPAAEVCDGVDNDCNGKTDDGNIPQVGQKCGDDEGECQSGTLQCVNGVLDCSGDVPPKPEDCNGLDDDCDGEIDNGIPLGQACDIPFDPKEYPNTPVTGAPAPCQPGVLQCDGKGGFSCVGGIGPQPEICDGKDNDCDGQVDEVGPPPNGIDGTDNPLPPPAGKIGEPCGEDEGECNPGSYQCINGQVVCAGGQAPLPEECNCKDDDCDGVIDNPPADGSGFCSAGKECVKGEGGFCGCAEPCAGSENPCPAGQECETVVSTQTGEKVGQYCVPEPCPGGCASQTKKDANGKVICAPAGTVLDNCIQPPVCVCKGQTGCDEPCAGVICEGDLACTNFGKNAGTCVVDNCFNNPCQGCGKVCNLGSCVDNPCKPDSCKKDEVCKPSSDFTTFKCVKSCADVSCDAGKTCVAGECVASCDPACKSGEVCDLTKDPPECVTDKCADDPCTDGSCCDPVTGKCGNCPCEGVVCPENQECKSGECIAIEQGTGGGGTGGEGPSASAASGTSAASGGAQGAATGAGGAEQKGAWGLTTGGGGCACEVGAGAERNESAKWLVALGAMAVLRLRAPRDRQRRKRRRRPDGASFAPASSKGASVEEVAR